MILHTMDQGSDEWSLIRAGKFTASTIPDLFMKESTKGYQDAIKKVAYERITRKPVESFKSDWMQRGNDIEHEALTWYGEEHFCEVNRVGFVEVDEWTGCSPDGLIGDYGMIQVKSPKWNTFFDYRTIADIPKDYITQCQAELLFCGREWNDLCIYDRNLRPKIFRIVPDASRQAEILDKIELAKKEVSKLISEYTNM